MQSRYYDPAIGRFINADTVLNSTGETNGFSLYTYGANNPVLNEDSSGNIPVETILDVAAIGSSAYDMVTKPCWSNLGYLAWDVTAAAVPYAPGSYVAKSVKYAGKAAKAAKVAKAAKAEKAAKKLKASKAAPKVVKAKGKTSKGTKIRSKVNKKTGRMGSLDPRGKANSITELYDKDGKLLQRRYYNSKGKVYKDIDYSHGNGDGSHTFPHEHTWKWIKGKPVRSK